MQRIHVGLGGGTIEVVPDGQRIARGPVGAAGAQGETSP